MPPESDLVKQLSALEVGDIRVSEPLCDHGTWCIGGPADVLVEPHSPDQLSALLKHLSGKPVPVAVIGDGSNLLFDDTGFRGVVVKIAGKMTSLEIDGTTVRALSGMSVTRMAHAVGSAGLSGIEHTVGIPGTFGGLLVMNGGSLRKNIGDNVTSVTVMDRTGKERTVPAADCGFSYRSSVFQKSDDIVLAGQLVGTCGLTGGRIVIIRDAFQFRVMR